MLILFCSFCLNQTGKAAGEIGLAKKAEITDIAASGANHVVVTYRIVNSGSETLSQIKLEDDYNLAFGQTGTVTYLPVTVNTGGAPASDVNLPVNTSYAGSGSLIQNGMMKPGTSATVTLTFEVKLTNKFDDNTIISGSANISSFDESNNEVMDTSTDGDTPDPGNPFPTPTTIPLTQIVIEATGSTAMNKTATPASTTASETDGAMTYIIRRKGYLSQTSRVYLNIIQGTATLGTSATGTDAWRNPLTETLTFNYGEKEKTITVNLVNDDMYEPNELFNIWLQTPTAQYTNREYNNVSILIPQVAVTITSEDPKPAASISTTSSLQIVEETGGGSKPFLADITLSGTSSQTITVPWSVSTGAASMNAPTSGTATFAPGEKEKTITVNINRDNLREADAPVRIQLGTPTNAGLGIPSALDFKIIDDDLRQIQWLNNTPKSSSGRMDAGSGINDTIDIHFLVIEATLDNPEVRVKLPANVTYVDFMNITDDVVNNVGVKYLSTAGNVVTFVLDGPASLSQNQKVHFKMVRKAECNAATGAKNDEVTVFADGDPGGVEEMTAPDKIGTGARTKYANYNIYLGNLSMLWMNGDNLIFSKSEMGTAKQQALSIRNNGQGKVTAFDFYVKFTSGIGTLQNAKIRGTAHDLTFTGPTTASGFDNYKISITAADIAFTGNQDNFFENGEEMVIEYEFQSSTSSKCGLKNETVWIDWSCKNPAASLNTTISLYEPQGKPELKRTLKTPPASDFKEDATKGVYSSGTPNNMIVILENTGPADAHYVQIPFTVSADNEWFNTGEITVTVTNNTASYDPVATVSGAKTVTIRNLKIPAGETATITFPVRRYPMERYTLSSGDVLGAAQFCRLLCGDITYSDECEDPKKKGTIGYSYFNTYRDDGTSIPTTNISYIPELMTTDIARIDMLTAPQRVIAFEFGNLSTIFPMIERQNWFGGSGSKLVITLNSTGNILLDAARLMNEFGTAAPAITFSSAGSVYTIEIPYNDTYRDYLDKNGRVEMTLEGKCSGVSTVEKDVNYTVDFVTNKGVTHKLYKKVFPEILIKCNIDPGANLRSLTALRKNYIKGDDNNDGIDQNDAPNTATMRLDRFYHNDTLLVEYKLSVGQYNPAYDPSCSVVGTSEDWKYLYATMDNMDSSKFEHVKSEYWIYHKKATAPYDSANVNIQYATAGQNRAYLEIDRNASRFMHEDSVVIRSQWRVKTIVKKQEEKAFQLEFWTYCEMNKRPVADIFTKRPVVSPCDELEQNYEREFANAQLYGLWHATNGPQHYKHEFTDFSLKNATFDYHLSVGVEGYSNESFKNELRQPYYIDSITYTLPYGYHLVQNPTPAALNKPIYYFGSTTTTTERLYYGTYGYATTVPMMQGTTQSLSLESLWHTNVWDPYTTNAQVADEGWRVIPYLTLQPTPKAKPGEETVLFRLPYKSPSNIPGMVNTRAGFILYNNTAGFVLECAAPEAIAYTDTVQWPIRIRNNSSAKDAKNGWIYIDGMDMKGVKLIDRTTNQPVELLTEGEGYENRWLHVGNLPKNTYRDYYLVARYNDYHCTDDVLHITPWYDYADAGDQPFPRYASALLDTTDVTTAPGYDPHVGRSVELSVINQQSEISGEITPLENTPKNPDVPTGGLFGASEIVLGNSFPVEIKLSSNDIIAVKEVGLTLNIPKGLKYIADSAYYQWKGGNTKVDAAAESKLQLITGAAAVSVNLTLDEITGIAASQLAGTYKTLPQDRELYLRFRLSPECTGFNADSIVLSAQIFGNRLCGLPAAGNNDTIVGRQIYLQGHRYYLMRDEIFTPNGNVFSLCDDARASRTIQVSFTRIGGGELQDDRFELQIPDHFDLDGIKPINYIDTTMLGIKTSLNPIVVSNTVSAGIRTVKWDLPREYSRQYTSNITVSYSVDLKLDVNAPNLPDRDIIVANITVDHVQCPGDASLLATDTVTLYIFDAKVGLAKDVAKAPPTVDGYVPVTYTYTITNYSNTALVGVQLSDNLIGMFGNLAELKNRFTITSSSPDLVIDYTYQGMGNLIQSGEIAGGATETVTLEIWVKPTPAYMGEIFENNAFIRTANMVGCEANDSSTAGLNPADPDPDPYLNAVPTPVWFNVIRFKDHSPFALPLIRIDEHYGDLLLTVERVGLDFSPAEVDMKLENEAIQPAGTEPAKTGTDDSYPIDAWWNESSMTKTIRFDQEEREKQIAIHIVDDRIYETLETFLATLSNQRYLSSTDILSLITDTLQVTIVDNDKMPTLNITAVADSLLEGTTPAPYGCTDMGFRLKLTNPTHQEVKVDWRTTTSGTGVPGTDFIAQAQTTAIIAPEDTVVIVTVCIIADDIPEPSQTVEVETVTGTFINVLAPTSAASRRARATIVDDDLVISLVKLKHLTCKGDASGRIIIQAAGGEIGTEAYTYSWTGPNGFVSANDTIANLQAGIYTVTVSDQWGTAVSESYTVEEPASKLDIRVDNVKNADCYGGNDGLIHTTVSGGWDSPNYVIDWTEQNSAYTAHTDDIGPLVAGVYILTVSDSARCVVTDTIAVSQPLPITIADTVIHDVICKGASDGSIQITPSGGNAPYIIYWDKAGSAFAKDVETISGLSPDSYTVSISDSKLCPEATGAFVVREPAAPLSAYVDTLVNVACKGDASGRIVIKAEGGWGQYAYTWNDGAVTADNTRSNLPAMDYSVMVTDSAGCSRTISPISVIEPPARMEVTLTATDETYQNGNDGTIRVNVVNGVPAYSYSWDDAPSLNAGYRNSLEAGEYTVTVTDRWNCTMTATAVIDEPKTVDNLPNVFTPDGDGFNDKLLEGFYIKVFDRWGLLLYEGDQGWDGRYKGRMMSAGTYFYVLTDRASGKEYKSSVLLQSFK
ncbi:MAG: gliding motility-associated C-terminal domain-containing protein [Bacteroidales bacterium]|nr:gliding motility-associated C-terminal domain-containing protein [Bacteroidales bacterium]